MAEEIRKPPTDTDRLLQMSLLLKAIDDLEAEKTEYVTEWKARYEKLRNQLSALRYEILSGQERLPLAGD